MSAIICKKIQRASLVLWLGLQQACIMVNRGTQQAGTLLWAVLGVLILYLGIRLLWRYLGRTEMPAWLRFLNALLASILIFMA